MVLRNGKAKRSGASYTELIQSKPNWRFVPGYIDEGISGGTTKKRDDFNRMIRDAKAGMFHFIITKEISRFSRSTLDSIKYTQELLENNVGVLFQNDNCSTVSLPTRGAWIEIQPCHHPIKKPMSLPTRGAWIEIGVPAEMVPRKRSLPTRGAWIEMKAMEEAWTKYQVAPHTGSVD